MTIHKSSVLRAPNVGCSGCARQPTIFVFAVAPIMAKLPATLHRVES